MLSMPHGRSKAVIKNSKGESGSTAAPVIGSGKRRLSAPRGEFGSRFWNGAQRSVMNRPEFLGDSAIQHLTRAGGAKPQGSRSARGSSHLWSRPLGRCLGNTSRVRPIRAHLRRAKEPHRKQASKPKGLINLRQQVARREWLG